MSFTYRWHDKLCEPDELTTARTQDSSKWQAHKVTLEQLKEFAQKFPEVECDRWHSSKYANKILRADNEGKPDRLSFWHFLKHESGHASHFSFLPDGRLDVNLSYDFYLLWRLCTRWMKWRAIRSDNGWWRHGVRLMARYQYYTILRQVNWRDPNGKRRAPSGKRKADEAETAIVPVKKPTFQQQLTSTMQQSENSDDSDSDDSQEALRKTQSRVPLALECNPSKTTRFVPTPLTTAQQLESYCGNNVKLVEYAKKNYGAKRGGMSTKHIRDYYRKFPGELPEHLRDRSFADKDGIQVCHLISKAKGGHEWVYNYGVYEARVNRHFHKFLPKQWDAYVGRLAMSHAENFARWVSKKASAVLQFGPFDTIQDHCLVR